MIEGEDDGRLVPEAWTKTDLEDAAAALEKFERSAAGELFRRVWEAEIERMALLARRPNLLDPRVTERELRNQGRRDVIEKILGRQLGLAELLRRQAKKKEKGR